jgi:hypothetical protein
LPPPFLVCFRAVDSFLNAPGKCGIGFLAIQKLEERLFVFVFYFITAAGIKKDLVGTVIIPVPFHFLVQEPAQQEVLFLVLSALK